MTFLVERLAELRRQLDHLRAIRPAVREPLELQADLTLHDDVMFSLLVVCQSVIDIAGELAARRDIRFQDFNGAIRALAQLIHEYVERDYGRVIAALDQLEPVDLFIAAVAAIERGA